MVCKPTVQSLEERINALPGDIRNHFFELKNHIKYLEEQLDWFKKQVFASSKADKITTIADERQLLVFEDKINDSRKMLKKMIEAHEREIKPRISKEEKYAHIPVTQEVVIEPDCVKENPEAYEACGEERTHTLEIQEQKIYRRAIIRPKYRLKADKTQPLVMAAAYFRLIEGIPGISLLVYILLSKYADHMPLHRINQKFQRDANIDIPTNSMIRWIERMCEWLVKIYDRMWHETTSGNYINLDETPINFIDPDWTKDKKIRKGQMLVYSCPKGNVLFDWSTGRSLEKMKPENRLATFTGVLQTDGYVVYKKLITQCTQMTHIFCWAHARRKFLEANCDEGNEIVLLIQQLYKTEKEIKQQNLNADQITAYRHEHAKPILDKIHSKLLELKDTFLPTLKITGAINYSLNHWEGLIKYIDIPNARPDNNEAENKLRPCVIGRKNWLFIGAPTAGDRPAIIYSILATCKQLDINPNDYLTHILSQNLQTMTTAQLDQLTPLKFKIKTENSI